MPGLGSRMDRHIPAPLGELPPPHAATRVVCSVQEDTLGSVKVSGPLGPSQGAEAEARGLQDWLIPEAMKQGCPELSEAVTVPQGPERRGCKLVLGPQVAFSRERGCS